MTHKLWEEKGIYWPDCENRKDYEHAFGRIDAIDAALAVCKGRTRCVQAGGWVGMWPVRLAQEFGTVLTFEPVPYLFDCLNANIGLCSAKNVYARNLALGSHQGTVALTVALSGCTSAVPEDNPKYQSRVIEKRVAPLVTLDAQMEGASACDAIFLDVERYEIEVLKGAKQLIWKFSPVITVEVLKGEDQRMDAFMDTIGYSLRARAHNDRIYTR